MTTKASLRLATTRNVKVIIMQDQIEQLSTAELKAIAAKIPDEIEKRKGEELAHLVEDIKTLCEGRGYTLQDLALAIENGVKIKRPVAIKYRHPSTGETWTGRGRAPLWVQKWLSTEGNLLEDLGV